MHHCEYCCYSTLKKIEYNRHIKTKKHIRNTTFFKKPLHLCDGCSTPYTTRQGLWNHQKKNGCGTIDEDMPDDIMAHDVMPDENYTAHLTIEQKLVEQKLKLKELELEEKKLQYRQEIEMKNIHAQHAIMQEMCNNQKIMTSAIEKIGNVSNTVTNVNNTTNNTINNINQFNLNVFLNDTCKDAMNIMDFVKGLKYTEEDIGSVARLGYAEAISNLLIKGLNKIDVTQRPIHCTDAKREKMYVKHDNEWKKDMDSTGNLKKAIKVVGHQNMVSLDEWKEKHPQHSEPHTRHHIEYLEICNQTMTGMLDDDDKEFKKIIKRLAPETLITKDKGDRGKKDVSI